MRCTICSNPLVGQVDILLASGTPIRAVARLHGLARSTVARHARHVPPTGVSFGLIRGGDGPSGPPDPLAEAFLLAERARTPRERLRALEQVRSATRLKLRGVKEPDREARALLDANIAEAEAAYRNAGDFETSARALSGWREALHQRIDAARAPDAIEVPIVVTLGGKALPGDPSVATFRPDDYFRGVPQRFRDTERFVVQRTVQLRFGQAPSHDAGGKLEVRDRANGALVWAR